MLPDSITKDGILLNGADTTYAPDAFIDADGKTPVGYDIDLTKALAAVFGLKPKVVTSTLDTIIPSVGSKYDLGISALTVSKEREEAVDFVTYFQAGMTYAVQKGNPKKVDLSNLCGVKVAVQTGSTEEVDINAKAKECEKAGKAKMEVLSYDQQTDVTTAVVSGKAAVFYADTPVTNYAIKQTGDELQTLGKDVDVTPQAIAVKKGDTQTAQAVKLALEELIKDGTYDRIMQKWGIESGAIDKPVINPSVE
jgi:polar amino acid transport system substrate-binding protein